MHSLPTYGARSAFALALAAFVVAIALTLAFQAAPAFAETDNIDDVPSELQQRVEETSAALNEVTVKVKELEQRIAENTARIAELEKKIPVQREKSASAMRVIYKMNRDGYSLVNAVLESGSFKEFLDKLSYMGYIHNRSIQEMMQLSAMQDELKTVQAELEQEREEALEEQKNAKEALNEAMAVRQQAIEAAAAAAAQEAAEQAAREAEAREQSEGQSEEETPSSGTVSASAPAVDPINSGNTDRDEFIAEWAPRIDAYLAGYPLAGYGSVFAAAAWDYGVDPRFSPAISWVESSKGLYCYRSYNAWGWGGISWSSWEEAIDAHVRGLARGYGYTVSEAGAKKYCPPNWEHWYNTVCAEMAKI
ncbi:MAG: hypothetical protein Q4D34_00450 [Eggerthellaceae bacterium]|nr:hypothetical protein [Eggerthellaceae bacterium]